MKTNQSMRGLWTVITVGFLAVSAGCSSKPPGCADAETVKTIKDLVVEHTVKYVASYKASENDPGGLVQKFYDALKVEVSGIVSEGYKADAKKQLCKGTMKITPITIDTITINAPKSGSAISKTPTIPITTTIGTTPLPMTLMSCCLRTQ